MAEYYGHQPVHIPGSERSRRREIMTWPRLNALLAIQPHWTEANLKLFRNGHPVSPHLYMEDVATSGGRARLASPAKLDVYFALGASLVGNSVHRISPEVRAVTDLLAERFAGRSGANVYCSFPGVSAFATHCDNHEVFAIHCEGEKTWRIYANRVEAPLEHEPLNDAVRKRVESTRGEVILEARMRPGDLLYIPRGFYHDALADSSESLHVTLSVAPPSGPKLFDRLEEEALRDPAFRAYLPDAREGNGATLRAHLDDLAGRLASIVRSPAFLAKIADSQRKLMRPAYVSDLPHRPVLEFYARTKCRATMERRDSGAVLRIGDSEDEEEALGALDEEAEWVLSRSIFSLQELFARFPHRSQEELRALVALIARRDIVRRSEPMI